MRTDPIQFALASQAPSKRPRYVIRIVYDTDSPALTSHSGIANVPGDVIEGVLKEPSAVSQRIIPDEGRSEIGSFSFSLVDLAAAFTEKIRTKLFTDGEGIRGKTVVFYDGYEGFDFTDFQVFQTQIVRYTSYQDGIYKVQCSDITREQRKDIFEPKFTTLRDSVSETDTTIPVYVTDAFSLVVHGTSWSDAPSSTVGYIRVENEIIRYTGKTSDSFTGCMRGALNTKAVAHAVDAGTSAERRTKVEEYIYLELPAVKMAWAILTGELYGSMNALPDHWNLGIDTSFVREADFTGIGIDLWDTTDDSAALPLRFEGLKKTDGKRFLEKEIYLVLGCYSPVYSDGTLGLRRLPALLGDSAPVAILTEREVISVSELLHDEAGMHNTFRINWNWDSLKEQFTRITYFTDADSVSIHGTADLKEYSFKGLHGSRHTDAVVAQRINSLRDAYTYPPERITVVVQGSLSYLEIGDVVQLRLQNVRDYAGANNAIDRAFAIFQKTHDSARNRIELDLFGSTARPLATPPGTGGTAPLPDAFYTAVGTNLNTIATITSNTMATGNYTLTGNADLTNSGAVFYWDNDLTIPSGCNLTIEENVQLRIRGFLTLNGTINGVGNGRAGVSDPGDPITDAIQGNAGFVGHSRGGDGLDIRALQLVKAPGMTLNTLAAALTRGQYDAFPVLNLEVSGSTLNGLPTDLRGTGGGPGGQILRTYNAGAITAGGAGSAGGAGLAIICRGMSLGVSATITLDGDDSSAQSVQSLPVFPLYPGSGGSGGPGSLLILLDGNSISIPDITGKFFAVSGSVPIQGIPIDRRSGTFLLHDYVRIQGIADPELTGYEDESIISGLDWSNAAHRIQYIPESQATDEDADAPPAAPSGLVAGPVNGGNGLFWTNPDLDTFDVIEVYASLDNDRSNAAKVGEARTDNFVHVLLFGGLRYYWIRARRNAAEGRPAVVSDWYPSSSTAGESSEISTPGEVPDAPSGVTATGQVNGILVQWELPSYARYNGKIEIYVGAESDTFDDATKVWDGYDFQQIIPRDTTDTARIWVALNRSGVVSIPSPVAGITAAASSVTAALTAYATPSTGTATATIGTNPRTASTFITCVASGGTPPYSYLWQVISGDISEIDINSPTFDDTFFSVTHNLDGSVFTGTARCTVTDDNSDTTYVDVPLTFNFPSIG